MINHYDQLIWEASKAALQGILANPNEHPEFRNPKETCEQANARLALEQGEELAEQFVKKIKRHRRCGACGAMNQEVIAGLSELSAPAPARQTESRQK